MMDGPAQIIGNMQRLRKARAAVAVVACTSEPYFLADVLQAAFERLVWVPPPDATVRSAILKLQVYACACVGACVCACAWSCVPQRGR